MRLLAAMSSYCALSTPWSSIKQIIGRGTRVRDDYGKLWFNILDYTGTATHNFADPDFDGDPAFAVQEEIDEQGHVSRIETLTAEDAAYTVQDPAYDNALHEDPAPYNISFLPPDTEPQTPKKYYFDGGHVEIVAELVHELDADGKQLRVVKLTDYTAEKVRIICANQDDLRARWADAVQRADIIGQLAERGIDFTTVAAQTGQPDADPFDLLCHLAFNAPILTRRQRADRVKKERAEFFNTYGPEAKEILDGLLEKYAVDGELQFALPDVLKIPPISEYGNVDEIIDKFGSTDRLRNAVNQLQSLLYAA